MDTQHAAPGGFDRTGDSVWGTHLAGWRHGVSAVEIRAGYVALTPHLSSDSYVVHCLLVFLEKLELHVCLGFVEKLLLKPLIHLLEKFLSMPQYLLLSRFKKKMCVF